MQKRGPTTGRPSGTDGTDYSYRMVVESRYTKVASGKSRLKVLLLTQTVFQVIGSLMAAHASQEEGFNNFAVVYVSIGFLSLLFGELGRRRSQANLLKLYLSLSAISISVIAAHLVWSDLFFKIVTSTLEMASINLIVVVGAIIPLLMPLISSSYIVGAAQPATPIHSRPDQPARTAIQAALSQAEIALAAVSASARGLNPGDPDMAQVGDCLTVVGDSVRQMRRSRDEMVGAVQGKRKARVENARTWVSTALTDQNLCADELLGLNLVGKASEVRATVIRAAMLAGDALALIAAMPA